MCAPAIYQKAYLEKMMSVSIRTDFVSHVKGSEYAQVTFYDRFLKRLQVRVVHISFMPFYVLKAKYDVYCGDQYLGVTAGTLRGYWLPEYGKAWWRTGRR